MVGDEDVAIAGDGVVRVQTEKFETFSLNFPEFSTISFSLSGTASRYFFP